MSIRHISSVGRGDNRHYVSCDEAAHECLCATIYPDCSYNQFFRNPKRDQRDYRERCRGCYNFMVVVGTFLIFPFYLLLKLPFVFSCCVFDRCHYRSTSICGWLLAICMFLCGLMADVIWVPIALVLFFGWLGITIVKACILCCGKKKTVKDGGDIEQGGIQPSTTVIQVND